MELTWGYNINADINRYITAAGVDVPDESFLNVLTKPDTRVISQDGVVPAVKSTNIDQALYAMNFWLVNGDIQKVRTILWPTEKGTAQTKWLHIPFSNGELCAIRSWVRELGAKGVSVQLAWGPLWVAQYPPPQIAIDAGLGFASQADAMAAWKRSIHDLLLSTPPAWLDRVSLDIQNEFCWIENEPTTEYMRVMMQEWFVYASAACRNSRNTDNVVRRIPYTVSTTLAYEYGGHTPQSADANAYITQRFEDAYSKIIEWCGGDADLLPDFVQCHWNGCDEQFLLDNWEYAHSATVGGGTHGATYLIHPELAGKTLVIGETDIPDMTLATLKLLSDAGIEVYLWKNYQAQS